MSKARGAHKDLSIVVLRGDVLGVKVYRGFARLCDLAKISKADVYDQHTNPTGTQRDLSPRHARDAYKYIQTRDVAFWPEVFLCVRDKKAIRFRSSSARNEIGTITINWKVATDPNRIAISRVDGNHRLHFADGSHPGFPPIEKRVSFCLAHDLSLEEEITLFQDINVNQRRMNTSHLDNIHSRLAPENELKQTNPALYIAQRLGTDSESVFFERVYQGGSRSPQCFINLRAVRTGIVYMLSQPSKLTALPSVDAQYKVIRSYFAAVKQWQPQAWKDPQKYLVLRGSGFWGICFIGQW